MGNEEYINLSCIIIKNDQTYLINLVKKMFKVCWPFFIIIHEEVCKIRETKMLFTLYMANVVLLAYSKPALTYPNSTMKTLEKGVEYV